MVKRLTLRKTPAPVPAARLEQMLGERTAELEHARHQTHELFDNIPALAVTTRRGQDGLPIIEDCNRVFPATLGYTRTEIIGRPLGDFYAPASRTAAETQPGARADDRLDGVERQLLDKYGGVLDTVLYLVPTMARNGAFIGTSATYLDVTEHKQDEARRRDLQTRYEVLVGQTLVGVCIVQDGSIVDANPKMSEITGYSLEEHTSFLSLMDLVAEHDRPRTSERLQQYARDEGGGTHVAHIRRKDDTMVPLEIQGGPVLYGGRRAVALIALDISDRIKLQNRIQHSQQLNNIGQLAEGVAHSFNNALTAIYGRCEVLLDQMSRADPRREEVEAILAVASDTAALTRRVLDFGQAQPSAPKVLDLNVVVGDTLRVATPLVGQHTSIVPALEPLLGLVEADAAQMEQVLLSLLLHARDVTPSGGVVWVTTANAEGPGGDAGLPAGGFVTVSVRDGGPGLTTDQASRLLEPSATDHGDRRRAGLATVQGLVGEMGGQVTVQTAPGQGCAITIALPRMAGTTPARPDDAAREATRRTVLVVEDEEQVRTAVKEWLEQAGYEVIDASNGRDALDAAAAADTPIDLVLSDVVMPGMNGRQFVDELTLTSGPIPVVYMSGYPNPVHPFSETDGPTLLEKPFSPRTLLRAVRTALKSDATVGTPSPPADDGGDAA